MLDFVFAHNRTNVGLFRDNGGSGYLLKPSFMRDSSVTFDPTVPAPVKRTITVEVISGRQLPKVGDAHSEVIDPYVVVEMLGVPADTQKFRTTVIGMCYVCACVCLCECVLPPACCLCVCSGSYSH